MAMKALEPAQELHIIVDVQRDFNDETGSLTSYARSFAKTGEIIRRVLPAALRGSPVLITFDTHPAAPDTAAREDYCRMLAETLGEERAAEFAAKADQIYADERKIYPVHCEYGSSGWELTEGIAALVTVLECAGCPPILLQKPSYDLTTGCVFKGAHAGRSGAEVLTLLREQGVKRACIHGLITPVCVKAAAQATAALSLETVVTESTVESYSEETHLAGLADIEALGATVIRDQRR